MPTVGRSRSVRSTAGSSGPTRGLAEASYYYANGEKIHIERDAARIAVDLSQVKPVSAAVREFVAQRKRDKTLYRSITLVKRAAVPKEVLSQLERQAALYPVYRYGRAILVALPEVRVEVSEPQKESIRTLASQGPVRAAIKEEQNDRMVLRPVSGNGADAITLANTLHETIHPKMAQARFVRIVPKP